LGAII